MRAIVLDDYGDEDVMRLGEVQPPAMSRGMVRIAVQAAGVNRADLLQRRGLYPPPPGASEILGLECAGRIAEVGEGATPWEVGQRVMALLPGGGYAEEAVVDAGSVIPVPATMEPAAAGGFPEVFLTAFLNLVVLGGMGEGTVALVHGGSGGVGTAAIQIGRVLGAHLLVTAGSDERCRRCLELGAAVAINYRRDDFVDRCRQYTDGAGVELILDCVGADYLTRNLQALAPGGRLVVIGLMSGARAELDLADMLRRRIAVIGSSLRSRSPADKSRLIASFTDRLGGALEDGRLHPIVDRALPLADAPTAHRALAAGEIFGKLVLTTG